MRLKDILKKYLERGMRARRIMELEDKAMRKYLAATPWDDVISDDVISALHTMEQSEYRALMRLHDSDSYIGEQILKCLECGKEGKFNPSPSLYKIKWVCGDCVVEI